MKRARACLTAVVILAASGCDSNSFEALRKQQVETATEIVSVLKSIRDRATADAARPRLKSLGAKWRDLDRRLSGRVAVGPEARADRNHYQNILNGLLTEHTLLKARVFFVPGGKEALDELGEIHRTR